MDDRPKLAELQEAVRTTKWYNLGIQLGLENNDLEEIAKQNGRNVDDCRRAMFGLWLRTSSKPTRNQLLYALRKKSVAEISIANEYERSFQTHGMYIYNVSSSEIVKVGHCCLSCLGNL